MQGLKQEELWPVVYAVFQHFRGQSEKLEKLEETMNRYFEKSKPSVHLQATIREYFSFLRDKARNQRASREIARGDCSLEGGQPKDSRVGPGVEVPSSESDGRGTSVSDKTEENTRERTPKRRRDAVVVDGIGKPSVLQKTSPETERRGNGGDTEGGWEFEDLSDLESSDFVRKHYWDDSGALMLAASSVALDSTPERSPLEGQRSDQGGKLDVERSDGLGAELFLDPSWMGCYSMAMYHQMTKKRGLLSKSVNALQKGMARLNLW